MAEAALGAAQWVVGKALDAVADGVLGAWAASRNFGLNIEDLRMELLLVKATLEQAARKDICGTAMEELLQRLRDSAHNAEDLLDKLDYFRIHDELHGTYNAADQHGEDGVHDLALNVRHTAKAVGKSVNCCPWQRAQRRQRSRGDSSSAPDTNQEVNECMPKLGKLFPGSSCLHPHVRADEDRGDAQKKPMLEFNRVEFSQKIKDTVEQLQPMRQEVNKILRSCGARIVLDTAQHRPTTTPQSAEPKLYGRYHVMNSIIHDITERQNCDKGLTVLPVIGPGGIGKTTLIQHIYNNQQVQNHFLVRIWICVSFNFNLGKVLEQIKRDTLHVEGENGCSTTQELIEYRLRHKRFLLVLDDIWQFTDLDDWKKLLLILGKSQEKGSMILVTTRQKEIANQVKKTEEPKELNGLEPGEFRKLFLVYVFDAEQYPGDKLHLLDTGDKIMEKLKCSPLAAKTVGRLLSKDLSLPHWRRVLKSKEWAKQTDDNGIMPALELSYDFLPFHLQQCFAYSALFPEDYPLRSCELISLWFGLDILIPTDQNPTFEDIGLSNIKELVTHGFFREEEDCGDTFYVMHDLLHDLALKVASHDCLSFRLSDVGSVKIKPSTRHLSLSTENLGKYNVVSAEELYSVLKELKTKLTVAHLQTLMLFGEMDEGFAKIFGDFFGEANALRVLYLPDMTYPVESILHNFSRLVHLRFLCLGTSKTWMSLPLNISKFYHLRVIDIKSWHGSGDFPEDMSNLAKLCHYYTPRDDELRFDIYNVGKLKLLEKLKVFRVNKNGEGFEPKQLEHLTKLWELGIYNLEKIYTKEEAAQAKLIEEKYLKRLTLDWDSRRSSVEPDVEAVVLEGLRPHENLEVLCIRGHKGSTCPTWLGDEFAVEALQSLCLDGVDWKVFPSFENMGDLRELEIRDCPEFSSVIYMSWIESLRRVTVKRVKFLEEFQYSKSSDGVELKIKGKGELHGLDQLLVFSKETSLEKLTLERFPPPEKLEIRNCPEFPSVILTSWIESLCRVMIQHVKLLKRFAYSKSSDGAELEIIGWGDLQSLDQVLVFDKETGLEKLKLERCPPLELKHLLMLTSLKTLMVRHSDCLVGPLGGGQGDCLEGLTLRRCPPLELKKLFVERSDGLEWQLPVEYMRIWNLNGDIGEEWQLPVEYIKIYDLTGNTGEELTELLPHLPKLSKFEICFCNSIKKLVVGVDVQQTTSAASEMGGGEITAAAEGEDDGVLLFPAHLCDSLQELELSYCQELVLVDPPTLVPREGWLQALRSLQRLTIRYSPKFLSAFTSSRHIFPSSLQYLKLVDVEGMGTLEPLSNLSSLTRLELQDCGEDLECQGLQSLLTTGGQLKCLEVTGSPGFFAGWDPRQALDDIEEGQEQQKQLVSSTLQELCTDDAARLLSAPVCSFFSSALTKLELHGWDYKGMERFSREQENALQLLSSLQELKFLWFDDVQQLPAGLRNLTSLKKLSIYGCPAVSSLPNDGLPESLQELYVGYNCSQELKQQCRGLEGTIPEIKIDSSYY